MIFDYNWIISYKTKFLFEVYVMTISVAGQHLEVGSNLSKYSEGRLRESIDKYLHKEIKGSIHFIKNAHSYILCKIVIDDGVGRKYKSIQGEAQCNDAYSAFDMALSKVNRQLRRYKSKLKNNHQHSKITSSIDAKKYVLNNTYENNQDDIDPDNLKPEVMSEHPFEILALSVEDAIMKMDLEELPAVMFRNIENQRVNVVYHKKDGTTAWIDVQDL